MAEVSSPSIRKRLGLFGDLPIRLLHHCLKNVPWFLEPVLAAFWTFFFFVLAKKQRRAVGSNLRAIHPRWGTFRTNLGAWRVFWNFTMTFADALRCETGSGSLDWSIDGLEYFDDLASRDGGCIILTAHMGNYDIAASMFASRFKKILHAVRAPEREPEKQRLRELQLRGKEALHPGFRVHYNKEGNHLGVELVRFLREGDLVALQGDRVMSDVSPMEVEMETGWFFRLPKGPLHLARVAGAPCFPLFILRDGWRRYRVVVLPELQLPPRRRGNDPGSERAWAAPIFETIRRHWNQWYVFESVFRRETR